jgi:EAL domain-containing protein (putative c-di-GMP-specific phosphodiesterase class I)
MKVKRSPTALLGAAERALVEARRIGSAAIRAHDPLSDGLVYQTSRLSDEIGPAIAAHQFSALYQPIVETDTGRVAAMDVQPVWNHPEIGDIPFGEFRIAAVTSGLSMDIHLQVLHVALNSLRAWQRANVEIPRLQLAIGNLELADPNLADRLLWETDRFDLRPEVLCIAVAETSVARRADEMIYANLRRLTGLGFGLAVTGFGAGSTSINVLRHIGVTDLRVDRAFVANVDTDDDQRRMLNAVLQMADVLKVRTFADGVDSIAEHSMLAQLGCGCVAGLAVAPPMPFEETIDWLTRHAGKVDQGRLRA